MKPAVLYLRYSPRPEAPEEVESIEFQRDVLTEHCEKHGYRILAERKDEELSGSSRKGRKGLEEAVALAIEHRAALMCYSQSRLARSTRDTLNVAYELQQGGASLILLDCNLDTSTPEGEMLLTAMAMTSQYLLRGLRKATSDSLRRKQRQGLLVSGRPPYGFSVRLEPHLGPKGEELVRFIDPVPEEQYLLSLIYQLDEQGMGAESIRRELAEYRMRDKPFRTRDIQRILARRLPITKEVHSGQEVCG